MILQSPALRVYVAVAPVDLRGSFNALSALVKHQLQHDPLSGQCFVFTNRRCNRLKLLYWDGSGLWCCAKRLERGRFAWPTEPAPARSLRPEEWTALVQGLDAVPRPGWYRR